MYKLICWSVEWFLQVVGDDLLMSNSQRMKKAIEESTCDALLLKVFSLYYDAFIQVFFLFSAFTVLT